MASWPKEVSNTLIIMGFVVFLYVYSFTEWEIVSVLPAHTALVGANMPGFPSDVRRCYVSPDADRSYVHIPYGHSEQPNGNW